MRKEWIAALIGTIAALVLAVGGTWFFTQASQVEAAEVIQPAASKSDLIVAQDLAPASQLVEKTPKGTNRTPEENGPHPPAPLSQ